MTDLLGKTVLVEWPIHGENGKRWDKGFFGVVRAVHSDSLTIEVTNVVDGGYWCGSPVVHAQLIGVSLRSENYRVVIP